MNVHNNSFFREVIIAEPYQWYKNKQLNEILKIEWSLIGEVLELNGFGLLSFWVVNSAIFLEWGALFVDIDYNQGVIMLSIECEAFTPAIDF